MYKVRTVCLALLGSLIARGIVDRSPGACGGSGVSVYVASVHVACLEFRTASLA